MFKTKTCTQTSWRLIGSVLALTFGLGGCVAFQTYKPSDEIVAVDQEVITKTMRALLQEVHALDQVSTGESSEPKRREAMELLDNMRAHSQILGAGKHIKNHLQLDKHIHQLNADIETAYSALERTPPSYYWVGRISGSCTVCHDSPIKQ